MNGPVIPVVVGATVGVIADPAGVMTACVGELTLAPAVATVRVTIPVATPLVEPEAVTVKVTPERGVSGVPEMTPVDELKDIPAGN